MQRCRICGGSDFYKEDGYFFCETCQTQNEEIRDEVLELRVDPTTRLRKTRIRRGRSDQAGEELGWTTWELYNFVLIGLTNELIEVGASPDIKLTVLQLWATYLGKVEVAFISTKNKRIPKLARRYNKRDAEIIYGKVRIQKKSRRSRTGSSASISMGSGYQSDSTSMRELNKNKKLLIAADYDRYIQSQTSTEGDGISTFSQSLYSVQSSSVKSSDNEGKVQYSSHAKEEIKKIKKMSRNVAKNKRRKYREKHVSTQYKIGPNVITPMRLWAILYLALRVHSQPIHLGDMLRYGREGHLSYYKLDHLLPPEVVLTKSETTFLSQTVEITHKGMRRIIVSMAKFLGVWDLPRPDFASLVSRYCQELALPRGIQLYAEKLIALAPPKMKFNARKPCVPNYEGRAMAYIIVVLKILLALDGITEYQISRVAEKINSVIVEKLAACKEAARRGYQKLLNGSSAVEAVEAALWWLECDEFFNCGYGSALNELGRVQMDAIIVDGLSRSCGSVAAVSDVEHPISLARHVLDHLPNSILVADGAKDFAKRVGFSWISEGNLIAPNACLSFSAEETCEQVVNGDPDICQRTARLTNGFGTVGCVAHDGCGIAAGATTGGTNRKLVGRVGDSAILGCGTYASGAAGCSVTGHGESIMKHGLSRTVVEDVQRKSTPREALRKHLSRALDKFRDSGGGVVIRSDGRWACYATAESMPYASIENDLITFGERAIDRGLLDSKLFNFEEWQKYIECRKTILVHSHFPTKLKYGSDAHGIDGLYIKFLDFINSKRDREEPEITNRKHFLPEELVGAMKRHMFDISSNDLTRKEIDIFPASLTPLHSYIEQLSNDPLHELPLVARTDFFFTKVGYMAKPYHFKELAAQCNIDLDIVTSNLHFVEKVVPPFEQPRMPSIDELKEPVEIRDEMSGPGTWIKKSEKLYDYVHKKVPCEITLNTEKQRYYDKFVNTARSDYDLSVQNKYSFNDTLPNGRLAIPSDSDSEHEEEEEDLELASNGSQRTKLLKANFCGRYNLRLSQPEVKSVRGQETRKNARLRRTIKVVPLRDAKGQFVKGGTVSTKIEEDSESEDDLPSEIVDFALEYNMNRTAMEQAGHSQEVGEKSLLAEEIDVGGMLLDTSNYIELSQISLFAESAPSEINGEHTPRERVQCFRPFRDYWTYHCIFSRVKSKNFELFEKALPRTFRWLLNECAHIVEMPGEDLYEEVCLIESFHAQALKPTDLKATGGITKTQSNATLSKW